MRPQFVLFVSLLVLARQPSEFVKALSAVVEKSSGLVSISVHRSLPVPPAKAQEAWLSFVFQEGGGLVQTRMVRKNDHDTDTSYRHRLLPVYAQEFITSSFSGLVDNDEQASVEYALTDVGPIWRSEIKEHSHFGRVKFSSIPDTDACCSMTWTCTYTALQHKGLWKFLTELFLNSASDNLVSRLQAPLLYTRTTRLNPKIGMTLSDITQEWIEFCFRIGGGLPINPPFIIHQGEPDGKDTELLRIPPFLREKVISVESSEEDRCNVHYKVMNPSLFTYQVHTHLGRVQFYAKEDHVDMKWKVEIRPYRGWEAVVKVFTAAIITMLARNFASHLEEPDDYVLLRPPRGSSGRVFAKMRKDSWLGGVLDAHLRDQRSTYEQALAILQPLTWGRSEDGPGEGAEWTVGEM